MNPATLRKAALAIVAARRCYIESRHAIHHGAAGALMLLVPRSMLAMELAARLLGIPAGDQGAFDQRRCFDVAERIVLRRGPCPADETHIAQAASELVDEAEAFLRRATS